MWHNQHTCCYHQHTHSTSSAHTFNIISAQMHNPSCWSHNQGCTHAADMLWNAISIVSIHIWHLAGALGLQVGISDWHTSGGPGPVDTVYVAQYPNVSMIVSLNSLGLLLEVYLRAGPDNVWNAIIYYLTVQSSLQVPRMCVGDARIYPGNVSA